MLNNIVLSGVLVRDPELRLYKNDQSTPYAFATLVSTKGSRSQKTVLIPIRLHGKQAKAFCEYKKKGDWYYVKKKYNLNAQIFPLTSDRYGLI